MIIYYVLCFALSCILSAIYFSRWSKRYNISFTMIYAILPFSNLTYIQIALAKDVNEALLANNTAYIAGCFAPLLITFCIISLCKIQMSHRAKMAMLVVQALQFLIIITNPYHHLFYKSVELKKINGVSILVKEYAALHTLFYVILAGYAVFNLVILIRGIKKKNVTNTILTLLIVDYCFTLFIHLAGRWNNLYVELIPLAYVESQFIYLFVIKRTSLYDIEDTVVESLYKNTAVGYVSFDVKRRYLGCTHAMTKYMPELSNLALDSFLDESFPLTKKFTHWMDGLDEKKQDYDIFIEKDGIALKITAYYLYEKDEVIGYQFRVRDNTTEKRYIDLLNSYNEDLEKEVEEQTRHIRDIQDKMVLGMADMVENRDNNTGGHIKRTSHVIRILIEEMKKDKELKLDPEFCEAMIKAAPMHDLGKIGIDDAILRKPGRFEDWEFEEMKKHAALGAEIVEHLLHGVEEPFFEEIAVNVAHYHHERVDGSGYPDKLTKDQIPLAARIMAIADVYDALVSKRCYKDAMSYEQAFQIIEEGMGTQFDEMLNPYFIACREKLETYYKAQAEATE